MPYDWPMAVKLTIDWRKYSPHGAREPLKRRRHHHLCTDFVNLIILANITFHT